ncbi:MAG TPA: IclR family transcriptional regulator [Solirubrobacteraceae bacterium]
MTESTETSTAEAVGSPADDETRSISKSLVKGLAILACFTSERPVLGISDLADELGASRSTTHRYACTLVELGYLEQDSKRRYRLGLKAADIGMSALDSIDLRARSRPRLERLRKLTSQTVTLAILDGAEVVCIERLRGYHAGALELELPLGYGSRLPAHCTASGKILLAALAPHEQRRVLRDLKPAKRTPRTVTSKQALRAELDEIANTQLASEDEELTLGLRSLAAPVHGAHGEVVAAIALTVPSESWSAERLHAELTPALSETAAKISAQARNSPLGELRSSTRTRPRRR